MEDKKKPKRKKYPYVILAIVLLLSTTFLLQREEIISIEKYLPDFVTSVMAQSQGQGALSIENDMIVFRRNGREVTVDIVALVNGSEYSVTSYLNWYHQTTEEGWKFSANVTIPDNPTGGFIANNLEEIRFKVHTENTTMGQVGNRLNNGIHYQEGCEIQGTGINKKNVCTYVDINFRDIIDSYANRNLSITQSFEVQSNHNASLIFDVRNINFQRGMTINLDPTVTITSVSDTVSILTNITAENNFTHLTIDPDSNVTFYMPFDVNTTSTGLVYDYINGSSQDATITGTAEYTNDGMHGGAFKFFGTDSTGGGTSELTFDDFDVLNGATELTACAWIYIAQGAGSSNNGVMGRANNPNRQFGMYRVSTEVFRFYVYEEDQTVDNSQSQVHNDVGWHHVCGWYNGSLVDIYVNGVDEDASNDMNVNGALESAPTGMAEIGDAGALSSRHWNGTIDEVIFFNKALTPTEILALYNNQSSRFFIQGTQEFQEVNVTEGNTFLNISINSTTNFESMINVTVGNDTGSGYDFGALQYAFTNNFVSGIPIGTPANLSIRFIFYAGDNSTMPFITPSLENDVILTSYTGVAPPSTCTYTSGNWAITCSDSCDITSDVAIDPGGNITMTGTGTFTIQNGVNITGWNYRQADSTCFYHAFGSGGFYQTG